MAKDEKITLKVEPLTRADKIEPPTKSQSEMWNDYVRAIANYGGRANGKSIFTKAVYDEMHKSEAEKKEEENKVKMAEKWIWVEGYKGTDKNMCCRDFQFELNKMFGAEQGPDVKVCESGFHLCLNLKDTFKYYPVGNGNRYFKVRALVREKDYLECTTVNPYWVVVTSNKLTSMSIEFLSELTPDKILNTYYGKDGLGISSWSEADKMEALKTSPDLIEKRIKTAELVALGYSLPFAGYVVEEDVFETAKSVATQPGLSMDMKALFILKDIYD